MNRRLAVSLWVGSGLVALLALPVVAARSFEGGPETTLCLFRRTTGIPCPGCGLTRAAGHLARGEWGEAWIDHPFIYLLGAEAAAGWAIWGATLAGHRLPRLQAALPGVALAQAGALGALWLGRLATGTVPW